VCSSDLDGKKKFEGPAAEMQESDLEKIYAMEVL
jgi:hypothetical protein